MSQHFLQSAVAVSLLAAASAPATATRLDGVDDKLVADSAAAYSLQGIAMDSAATVQQWTETDDLDEGEGPADRLIAMMVGIADDNKDGELDEDEQMVVETAMNEAWSYMAAKGVAESDLDDLFNSDDPAVSNAAGSRIMDFLKEKLPNGAEADDEIDDFAFGVEAQEGVFDSAGNLIADAVYKKRFAIRGGKKVLKRKRISGVVRLNAKQKVAIRKARMKSNSSGARAKRMRSMRVRKSMNLK